MRAAHLAGLRMVTVTRLVMFLSVSGMQETVMVIITFYRQDD